MSLQGVGKEDLYAIQIFATKAFVCQGYARVLD